MCCESVVNKVLMGSKRLKNKLKIRLLISSKCHFFFFPVLESATFASVE